MSDLSKEVIEAETIIMFKSYLDRYMNRKDLNIGQIKEIGTSSKYFDHHRQVGLLVLLQCWIIQ